jgi:hypothetical protein
MVSQVVHPGHGRHSRTMFSGLRIVNSSESSVLSIMLVLELEVLWQETSRRSKKSGR